MITVSSGTSQRINTLLTIFQSERRKSKTFSFSWKKFRYSENLKYFVKSRNYRFVNGYQHKFSYHDEEEEEQVFDDHPFKNNVPEN